MNKVTSYLILFLAFITFIGCEPGQPPVPPADNDAENLIITPGNQWPIVVCDSQTFTAESLNGEELIWILDGEIVNRGPEFVYTPEEDDSQGLDGKFKFDRNKPDLQQFRFNHHLGKWNRFHQKYHRLIALEACTLEEARGWIIIDGDLSCRDNAPGDDPTPAPGDDPTPAPGDDPTPAPGDDPAPAPGDDPAPAPGDDPAPEPGDDPAPAPGDDPAPAPGDDPAPEPGDDPTPEPGNDPAPAPGNDSDSGIAAIAGNYQLTGFEASAGGFQIDESSPQVTGWSGSMTISDAGRVNVKWSMNGAAQEPMTFDILQVEGNRIQFRNAAAGCTDWINFRQNGNNVTFIFPQGTCGSENIAITLKFQKK